MAMATAAAVWLYQLFFAGSFDPRQFQDTEGIDTVVVSVVADRDWYRVRCRVTNRGQRMAEHVVLTARVLDSAGEVIAMNPLASVSQLAPQTSQLTTISLPRRSITAHYTAEVDSTLVAWAQ